jgi:hypothetical protein
MNFAPLFFDKVKIFTAPGYNMAYWNLHERTLSSVNNKYFVNDKYPLIFYHYSGYNVNHPDVISRYQNRYTFNDRPEMKVLFDEFTLDLRSNGVDFYSRVKCAYSDIKESYNKALLQEKINKIPILKRTLRRILLKIIRQFNIVLDYNKL